MVAYIFSLSLLFASVTLTPAMSSQPQADVKPGCDLQVPQMSEKVWTHTMHQTSEVEFPLKPVNPNVKFYICDRCGERVDLHQENLLQIAAGNRMLLRRWKADENVQWFCTPCLATTEGCGIGEVQATRDLSLPLHPVQKHFLQNRSREVSAAQNPRQANCAAKPCAPSRRFRQDHVKVRVSRFLELKKKGKLSGYNFIGWLNKTGKLAKEECPKSPHTPIYWKRPESDEWFCFSQTTLMETVEKEAILSVDDWKRLVQSFSKDWSFLGFVHDASGKCINHVPPPISAQTSSKTVRLRTNPERRTKVRLHTDHGQYDVIASCLKDTVKKECGALPPGSKMRLIPRPSLGLLQKMQCHQNKHQRYTTSTTANIIFSWQVQSDAPSVVKDCLNAWNDGVALDIYARRLLDRHASCADKNPNIWFCPPSPERAVRTSWGSLLEENHQTLSRTNCWYNHVHEKNIRLSMAAVAHDTQKGITNNDINASLKDFPILLQMKPAFSDNCQVELHNDLLQQTHSISIRDLKRLATYHKLASEIATMDTTEEPNSICNFFYIGTLLSHEEDPTKLAILLRFLRNTSPGELRCHVSTGLTIKLADFMHVPDSQTDPSGNWLIVFKSGRTSVRPHKSYVDCRQFYSVKYKRRKAAGEILFNYNGRFYQSINNFCDNYKGLKSNTSVGRARVVNTVFPTSAYLVIPGRNCKKYRYITDDGEQHDTKDEGGLESVAYLLKTKKPAGTHSLLVCCETLKRAATSALEHSKRRKTK